MSATKDLDKNLKVPICRDTPLQVLLDKLYQALATPVTSTVRIESLLISPTWTDPKVHQPRNNRVSKGTIRPKTLAQEALRVNCSRTRMLTKVSMFVK